MSYQPYLLLKKRLTSLKSGVYTISHTNGNGVAVIFTAIPLFFIVNNLVIPNQLDYDEFLLASMGDTG